MIEGIINAVKDLLAPTAPWVTISPWEESLRVRAGKWVKKFGAGIHFKIPFVDRYYTQSVRTRISDLGRQTLSTLDGKVVTISGVVEFEIVDIEKLYSVLHHAEDTIINCAKSELIRQVSRLSSQEVSQHLEFPMAAPLLERAGIRVEAVRLTDCAVVKTYRLIGDKDHWKSGDVLETDSWAD